VQASLTGHLVLSTLHTNDAPNSVTRLLDMGLESYKIASALRGIVAQRLMRRLCPVCKQPAAGPPVEHVARLLPRDAKLFQAVGCQECAQTGYHGRFSIVEVLMLTPELERLIGSGATAAQVAAVARKAGMRMLWESGIRHVVDGETTIDELLRVTDVPQLDGDGSAPAERSRRATPAPRASGPVAAPPASAAAPTASSLDFMVDMELLEDAPPVDGAPRERHRGISVLLVDDEDQLRRVMRDLLEREGYTVYEAADGVAALDETDRRAPDIIVLDLNLPGLDGYEVLARLRNRAATRQIPVVVLTAKGDEENEVRVFELGADDFLSKPFRARALAARLEAVLGRRSR